MANVLCFGSLNLDLVYRVPGIVRPGETTAALERAVYPGGKGLNQSIALARAGASVRHAGVVGSDGELLMRTLADAGVDTTLVRVDPASPSGHAVIQVNADGQNAIVICAGTNGLVTAEDVERALAACEADTLVVLQNEISALDRIMTRAMERGLRVVFNPSPFSLSLLRLPLDQLDTLLVNELEARYLADALAETDDHAVFAKLQARFPAVTLVMTLGAQGVLYAEPGRPMGRCPAHRVAAVDTTGAGDTFTGYYLAARVEGQPIDAAVRLATQAAAIAVTRAGAATAIPTRSEVAAAMKD